ncbi:MAG: DUF4432 family protein [Clostridia bacterium]|nr:DUF4432 family protein [Clostridia bacterium]
MQARINLFPEQFSRCEKNLFTTDKLCCSTFEYSTGVKAVKIRNDKGSFVVLPFMGQMIWDIEFCGRRLTMKSIYDEPEICYDTYGESYGCFLMHCGLSAMGNPTEADTHKPHGELPIAKYKEAYILFGEDEKGKYISVGGVYSHKRAYDKNYDFCPEVRLYEDASEIEVTVHFENKKDLPLEYFYLCHINYLPIEKSHLYYTARPENITVHSEVPAGYPKEKETNAFIERLEKDKTLMDYIDSETQSYAPEIVFTCIYDADEQGNAYTLQEFPDGYGCYVCHRPEELPFGVRWIARTEDEDALGMVLPATAEHKGYLYCKERGQEKYLPPRSSMTFHIKTGLLDPENVKNLKQKIKSIK